MIEKIIKVRAADGLILAATLRIPTSAPIGCIQINSGTGIPQYFYKHFASYMTERGYVTITFDYRGIGMSKNQKLRGFKATNFDWGMLDMTAILAWTNTNYPDLKKIVVGHSMGGQLIGIMKNLDKIDKAYIIASGTGFWKDMPRSKLKTLMPLIFNFLIPVSTFIFGYANTKLFRQGENLPKGVALQWKKWCMNKTYWDSDFNMVVNRNSFESFHGSIVGISMEDDNFVSEKSKNKLLDYYTNATVKRINISPSDIGLSSLGHFGFFRKKSKKLWSLIN